MGLFLHARTARPTVAVIERSSGVREIEALESEGKLFEAIDLMTEINRDRA